MWFKNLYVFTLEQDWTLGAAALEEILAQHTLRPCPQMSMLSQGWVPPDESPALVESVGHHLLIALGSEEKLLPAAVVNDLAAEHAEAWEQSHGFKPSRKTLRDLKERATAELLPRAFVRRRRTRAWIDPGKRRIVVDAASPARAEALTEHLRENLGGLELSLPQATRAPADTMTEWLRDETAPGRFVLGEECELTGSDASKPVVRYLRHPLLASELNQHIDAGFTASRLALHWNDRINLLIDDKLQIKRVRFADLDEAGSEIDEKTPELRFEAEFTLMTGDYALMLDDLLEAFSASQTAAA